MTKKEMKEYRAVCERYWELWHERWELRQEWKNAPKNRKGIFEKRLKKKMEELTACHKTRCRWDKKWNKEQAGREKK